MNQTITIRPDQALPDAFPERQALMPIWGGIPVPNSQWQRLWRQQAETVLQEDALAYLHIPFCANHCVFCGFYRNAWKDSHSKQYTDKVIEELAREAEIRKGSGKIRAVYFGGGTPTALLTDDLVRLIRACYQYLPLADGCEFTLEGRMSHFPADKARAAVDAGVNRISIGIQTFDTAIRRRLGRRHSGAEAAAYLEQLGRLNAVLVADLIFGLPGQSDEIWHNDLRTAAALPLAGLDTYAFNCYPFLPINRMIEKGAFPPPPGFDTQSLQYAYAADYLARQSWEQISNNHFAYPGRGERNLYNRLVKSNIPCLAFGSGAGGNGGGYSYQVQSDLDNYLATPEGEKNIAYMSRHSENKYLLGRLQHDIELGFIDSRLFAPHPRAAALLTQWAELGLTAPPDSDGLIRLHTSGRYWSPTLIRKLMLALPANEDKEQLMATPLSEEQKTVLRNTLAENPGQILEMLAGRHQCSFEEIINCLPAGCVHKTDGSRFVEIMQAVAAWDEAVTFIAHTPDVIAEVTGKLPGGSIGRGFYNFKESEPGGIHGHIYYENCAAIYLIERPFMGKRTVSLNFINRAGGAMFKIYVGRDKEGELIERQIHAMRALFGIGEA
ncbi:Oxygen-independent coproporphyrinogen-III oxidase [Kingella potus]|uniref:Oxygen-independent coproporphyrinogen-III oxidase n=1 Tax=Kingella potus TaxID=265175 RepID=A0A377R368_9NEIS|nr:heme anaerobic degradation radical SAM methyltransferase ChuW/HutW [Kingella potus]STR03330.1 Oxygen-independent coproporphyrinogen-III oxidase [Kingella potus]